MSSTSPAVEWFTPSDHTDPDKVYASVWIRCLQLIPYLSDLGFRSHLNDLETNAPVAVFVRKMDDESVEAAKKLKQRGIKVVFDLCVNYLDPCSVTGLLEPVTVQQTELCRHMLEVADVVSCASSNIAERVGEEHPMPKYLPDSFDTRHFTGVKDQGDFERDRLRAVWSGTAVKAGELSSILPLLESHDIELVIVSNERPLLRRSGWLRRKYPFEFIPWGYQTFPADIMKGEFCLSYRKLDTPYNRGHSFFKIGIFMTEGVPAICSPLPSYQELLAGGGGAICRELSDWAAVFAQICSDRSFLRTWSEKAADRTREYSTEQIASRYAEIFDKLL